MINRADRRRGGFPPRLRRRAAPHHQHDRWRREARDEPERAVVEREGYPGEHSNRGHDDKGRNPEADDGTAGYRSKHERQPFVLDHDELQSGSPVDVNTTRRRIMNDWCEPRHTRPTRNQSGPVGSVGSARTHYLRGSTTRTLAGSVLDLPNHYTRSDGHRPGNRYRPRSQGLRGRCWPRGGPVGWPPAWPPGAGLLRA